MKNTLKEKDTLYLIGLYDIFHSGTVAGFLIGAVVIISWLIHTYWAEQGKVRQLPRMPMLDVLEDQVGRAAELGKPVHFAGGYGTAGLSHSAGPGHLAGLAIGDYASALCAKYDVDFSMSLCWPELIPIAADFLRRNYATVGKEDVDVDSKIYFYSTEYWGFGQGGYGTITRLKPAAVILAGWLYAEAMVFIEGAASVGATVLGGTPDGNVAGYFVGTADYYLFPTEVYAAGAFLSNEPSMIASIGSTDVSLLVWVAVLGIAVIVSLVGSTALADFLAL